MVPVVLIAIASTASALAAAGSLVVALHSWWRERVRECRAELFASVEHVGNLVDRAAWLTIWNDGPGAAYAVEAVVVYVAPENEVPIGFGDNALEPGSSDLRSLGKPQLLPPRTRVTLTWKEQMPDLPRGLRWLVPGGRIAGTRPPRRRVVVLDTEDRS